MRSLAPLRGSRTSARLLRSRRPGPGATLTPGAAGARVIASDVGMEATRQACDHLEGASL
ncbi:hypothetical protein CA984_16150 [Streptosporangium minutum]|uniref:Uncharacterized protein n=1 Tax=Streptosporangium minutum TaxID=569862 RepID=A0A243RMB3_9ACTN|nr:hypothetical protein CA984_16150 [Streptosporangium minutum]